jgi:UDP-glucuronate decarboxylase
MAFNDGRVVSNFICQALRGEPLTIYGDGSQTRSFCYVDDLIDGLLRLMAYDGPDCHQPHNIGNPVEFTMLELAHQVRDAIQPGLEIVHLPLPQDDPKQRRPDIARSQMNLGWNPVIPLKDGIERTIAEFRERFTHFA